VRKVGWLALEIRFFGKKPKKINALFIHPNKDVEIVRVGIENKKFVKDKLQYIIDEKAIYFWKEKPLLFYRVGYVAPLIFGEEDDVVSFSLSAAEIRSVIESKAVNDLLTAGTEDFNWTLWAAIAAAVLSAINLGISFGLIKVH